MCASWDIRYFISTSGSRPPSLICPPHWRRLVLTFVQICCLMLNICGFRWNFSYIPSPMSGLSAAGFTSAILISCWTRIECACCYQQRWLRHPQKKMQQCWICFQGWFTPFDSMVTKFVTFSPKNHPHRLHFRWRHSIGLPGWTILKISTSFHHALMALGIRRSAMKNSDGRLIYSRKTKGRFNFAPPLFEG